MFEMNRFFNRAYILLLLIGSLAVDFVSKNVSGESGIDSAMKLKSRSIRGTATGDILDSV